MATMSIVPQHHTQHKQQTRIKLHSSVLGHFPGAVGGGEDKPMPLTHDGVEVDVLLLPIPRTPFETLERGTNGSTADPVHRLLIVVFLQQEEEEEQ